MLARVTKIATGVVLLAAGAMVGLTITSSAGVIGMGRGFLGSVTEAEAAVTTLATELGWAKVQPTMHAAAPTEGARELAFLAKILPWSSVEIDVTIAPVDDGAQVDVGGHAGMVKELVRGLDERYPVK